MDAILIEGLELSCIVGMRPHERVRKQTITLDLELGLDLMPAGRSGRIGHTCDYDLVADSARALLCFREYHLIEVATEELAAMLLGLHPALQRVRIRLTKPAALTGRARSAAVQIERRREDFPRRRIDLPGGRLEVLLESREAGLYASELEPGTALAPALVAAARADQRRTTAWIVSGRVATATAELGPGASLELEPEPRVRGEREDAATVFLCTTPGLGLGADLAAPAAP